MDQHSGHREISGEAVVLEVTPGRYLFVLLTGYKSLSRMTFHYSDGYPRDFAEWAEAMEDVRERRDVPRENFPLMVTFTDIADPATVTRVDPDNLAATFGPGVRLRSLTLEITDEAVTEGRVEKVLGWLSSIWPNRLDGRRFGDLAASNRLANDLSANSFSTEIGQ